METAKIFENGRSQAVRLSSERRNTDWSVGYADCRARQIGGHDPCDEQRPRV